MCENNIVKTVIYIDSLDTAKETTVSMTLTHTVSNKINLI